MELKDALKIIFEKKGRGILKEPMMLKGYLMDIAPEQAKVISVLSQASASHIFDDIAVCEEKDLSVCLNHAVLRMYELYAKKPTDTIKEALIYALAPDEPAREDLDTVKVSELIKEEKKSVTSETKKKQVSGNKMPLIISLVLVVVMIVAFLGTNTSHKEQNVSLDTTAKEETGNSEVTGRKTEEDEADGIVMTYEEYAAADINSAVTIEAYVQAKEDWWDNTTTVFLQDEKGAYYVYQMECSEEDYAKLIEGRKIRVTGNKSKWASEVEIVESSFQLEKGNYIAPALDVTALLGTDDLIMHQNKKVAFKGMTVEAISGDGSAFFYRLDGSGSEGDDLYFNASYNGKIYQFTVESYLCGPDTDVYKAVKELKVGDKVDLEGFLYWYDGPVPQITSVSVR